MILKLLMALLKSKIDDALAKAAGGAVVTIKGVAHGLKLKGNRYTVDVVLRREEP